ncbi:EmrB/QacA subfamily drug resistance transporter [Herbihabitans rhizosphaerae]|uniref:EmrB/QacA subfamily drug resistance transporter n=1 Tax=Herbihabitans rhizosphaerae TaxID=1872711 RepID=A0A4V2ETF8_9PSEU|nr:MFS transporter [Herbihabitans rhizosphaerae]RZS40923.1 EmrB/QacA subfamily drug resistance transporter [Herbihabitans rhizosphaerae]
MSHTTNHSEAADAATPSPRRWRALALLCIAYFMIIIDSQIVVLALPTIGAEFHLGSGGSSWVMSAYLLAFGGLLLLGGRTADLLGGRRMFLVGTGLFLLASIACGIAWTGPILIAARVIQGAAAAIMAPTAMAVLMATFAEGPERNRAIGIWTGMGAFGATAALLVGGTITEGLGWEWIFFINAPLAGLVLVAGPRLLPETAVGAGPRSLDLPGAITVTGFLVLLVLAVVSAPSAGWGSARTLGLLAAAIVLLALFVVAERRAKAPLVPLSTLRNGQLIGGNLMTLFVCMSLYGGAYFMSVYAQEVLGFSPTLFGLSTAVYAVMSIAGSNLAGALTTRFGYQKVAVGGAVPLTVGLFLLSRVPVGGDYWTDLLPGMIVFGFGIGTTVVASAIAALSNAKPDESGLASGINNSVFQIGAALGIALCTTVSIAATDTGAPDRRAGLNEGVQAAFGAAAVLAAGCLVVAIALTVRQARVRAGTKASDAGALPAVDPVDLPGPASGRGENQGAQRFRA